MSLWQKPEQEQNRTTATTTPKPHVAPPMTHGENRMSKPANIGQSVQINGELTGQEDLIIDGKIDGKIMLKDHQLTIGPNGHINAEVHAKSVQINGEVTGNITADDKVEITPSGSVHGDICAPRVALADGSSFKGSIDMGRKSKPSTSTSTESINRDVPLSASAGKD
jgi:cytoskeletal protein CcmA (bactofilin family)